MAFNAQQFQQQQQQYQQHYQQNHPQYGGQCAQSQHYGNYGQVFQQDVFKMNAWQAYNMQAEHELQSLFMQSVNSNPANQMAQGIQSEDLCNLLNNTQCIRNYYGINWSREMCSILMAMLDRNPDGFMQWPEFMELQRCLLAWHGMFKQYDSDGSGYIEAEELNAVIKRFGYRLTPESLTTILKRYSRVMVSNAGNTRTLIAFDDFVAVCVRIRAYTDAFRKRDRLCHGGHESGNTSFSYDDFIRCTMCL